MVKVISLSEAAYAALLRRKKSGMSFSDVVMDSFGSGTESSTESREELLKWLDEKAGRYHGRKENVSQNIDKILYGKR
jgi:predicted CopG family antitoxin